MQAGAVTEGREHAHSEKFGSWKVIVGFFMSFFWVPQQNYLEDRKGGPLPGMRPKSIPQLMANIDHASRV